MRLVVTGASGYIGTRLTHLASERGHDIVIASRKEPTYFTTSWLYFDLLSLKALALPKETDVVIHLAANTTQADYFDKEAEVITAQRLVKSAQEVGAKFIFVSSQTARPDAPTSYGITKWRIEQVVLSAGGNVARPGQVYGGELRGLFGTLVNTIHNLPLLPAFIPAPKVQPIHVDDLAEGLLRIAERNDINPRIYCLATPKPVSFSEFLKNITKSRLRCQRLFFPVPIIAIKTLALALGDSLQTQLRLDQLLSLFDLPFMETASDLEELGLTLRPLSAGMHPSGNDRRRGLLQEGHALLSYVLKEPPCSAVLRRYVRAVEHVRNGNALGLPKLFLSYPIFLSLLDYSTWADKTKGVEFSWRLDAATMLAETTPLGAYRFLGIGSRNGVLISLLSIINAMTCEIFWRLLRVLFSPLIRFFWGRARGAA